MYISILPLCNLLPYCPVRTPYCADRILYCVGRTHYCADRILYCIGRTRYWAGQTHCWAGRTLYAACRTQYCAGRTHYCDGRTHYCAGRSPYVLVEPIIVLVKPLEGECEGTATAGQCARLPERVWASIFLVVELCTSPLFVRINDETISIPRKGWCHFRHKSSVVRYYIRHT